MMIGQDVPTQEARAQALEMAQGDYRAAMHDLITRYPGGYPLAA